ncbi:DUF6191 domain-containing protein [Streptomyces aureocirculatus]|uniref:DUF6191 domain-containing protein n=1 Tax=Streptomyces aureocirculatus TaxID=67275 RepID=UPI00056B7285|nr:DUF6191 domain-containing protein [Streptomyces aureocirculatus]
MFNVFEQLFAPGRKHTDDENKRLELSRVDVDDGDPGRGPIDLTSGTVVVRVPRQSTTEDAEPREDGPEERHDPEDGDA